MANFITLEGSDGSGKSTLLARIQEHLTKRSIPFEVTREPGGTPIAEEIREVLLKPGRKLTPIAELFLFEAARAEHVMTRVRPALASGRHVLCDRYTHSTQAYQGVARGLGEQLVSDLNITATGGLNPDAVIWLRIRPTAARARIESRGGEQSRIDAEAQAFHEKVFAAFERMSQTEASRFIVLDAERGPEDVFNELVAHPLWKRMFA